MKVATYNIRFDNLSDINNFWSKRLPVIVDLIKFYDFDVFGTQEALHHQLQDLTAGLPDYGYIGVGREDGKEKGEHVAIFYNKKKYDLIRNGDFWLCPTSDVPSKGWDAAWPRVCTWGQFAERASGFTFCMFNVHFDYRGEVARKESTKLIVAKIGEIAAASPVILTGDFNFIQHSDNYNWLNSSGLLRDSYEQAAVRFAPNGTFNDFDINRYSEDRIDHIFLSSDFKVERFGILTNTYGDGKYPSDHFPILLELSSSK